MLRQNIFMGDNDLILYYQDIWKATPGSNFKKAFALLYDYSGYESWSLRLGRTHVEAVESIIKEIISSSDTNTLAFPDDIEFLLSLINAKIELQNINTHGHFAAILQVILNNTQLYALDFHPHSDKYKFYLSNNNAESLDAAKKLQSFVRGSEIRNKLVINPLSNHQLEDYPAFVIGNDPMMPKELDSHAEAKEKIGVVATSGLRAVSLACKLGNQNSTPKIFIVDNSLQVVSLWKAMREFFADVSKTGTADLLFANLPTFLDQNKTLYRDFEPDQFKPHCTKTLKYLSQDINGFFKALISKYGFDYVKKVILHTSIIQQSWADTDTFQKIKNLTTYLKIDKIYMYPSNIVACIDDINTQMRVLNNIKLVSPILSIHTNVCDRHHKPEEVFLVTNQNPSAVASTLFSSKCLNPSHAAKSSFTISALIDLLLQQDPDVLNAMYALNK